MRKAFRRFVATILAAALLCGLQPPLFVHAAARVFADAASAAPQAVASPLQDWRLYPPHRFLHDFPALAPLGLLPDSGPVIQATRRTLERTGLDPPAAAGLPAEEQLQEIRKAVRTLAESAVGETALQDYEHAPSAASVEAAAKKRDMLRDLVLALAVLSDAERGPLEREISSAKEAAERLYRKRSSELIESKFESLERPGVQWNGRTADIPLEDGAVLSFKRHSALSALGLEEEKMGDARRFGLESPVALPGDHGRERDVDGKKAWYLAYLKPAGLAEGYGTYLNDRLPDELGASRKAEILEAAALKSVDHMLLLLYNGRAHASLMALSHAEAHWEWDYWRWNILVLGGLSYGPSSFNSWRKGFRYPNIRLSGLADFEHVEPLGMFEKEHRHADHGLVRHDAYSSAIGQNLTELSFTLMHAGMVNKLSDAETARIVWRALKRYLEGVLPGETLGSLREREILEALSSSSRHLRAVARFWTPVILSLILSLWIGLLITLGSWGTWHARMMLLGWMSFLLWLGHIAGLSYAPWAMPGWAFHPLIMKAIKPSVELLRSRADLLGLEAAPHPSGWQWSRNMKATLLVAAPVALIIPAGLFFISLALLQTFLASADVFLPVQSVVAAPLLGAALLPLRIGIARLQRVIRRQGPSVTAVAEPRP